MFKPFLSVAVVIPTRNRQELVRSLLKNLKSLDSSPSQIIVIDSSDEEVLSDIGKDSETIIYRHVDVKSAAIQRNIGMSLISKDIEYISFLDDDVTVPIDYLSRLITTMGREKAIGISGLAINPKNAVRALPLGFVGLVHRAFLLDSKKDGLLLKSAINIPIRATNQGTKKADWLIGCSIWKRNQIEGLEFENNLMGQSLGEDVIFSFQASKMGLLVVDSEVILDHLESPVSRPSEYDFWKMWIKNRRILIGYMGNSPLNRVAYHWANCGQLFILVVSAMRNRRSNWGAPKGLAVGILEDLAGKI